jgi:hypothetical protein
VLARQVASFSPIGVAGDPFEKFNFFGSLLGRGQFSEARCSVTAGAGVFVCLCVCVCACVCVPASLSATLTTHRLVYVNSPLQIHRGVDKFTNQQVGVKVVAKAAFSRNPDLVKVRL